MAVIAAVNESTWEHFKMTFWPGLFLGIIEYFIRGKELRNFVSAKFTGLLAMPIITMILFYVYTSFTHHSFPADFVVFFLSVAGGQLLSMFILLKNFAWAGWIRIAATSGLILMIAAFSTQSYFPPRNFILAHPGNGEYGIIADYSDHDHWDHDDKDEH